MRKSRRLHVIPPNWPMMITMLVCMAVSLILIKTGYKSYFTQNRHIPYSLFTFSALGFLAFASNYAIYPEKLVHQILFIPVRVILWNKVSSASYFPAKPTKDSKNVEQGASLFLTISPCLAFSGSESEISKYIFRHMLRTVLINLHPQCENQAMSAINICLQRHDMKIRY